MTQEIAHLFLLLQIWDYNEGSNKRYGKIHVFNAINGKRHAYRYYSTINSFCECNGKITDMWALYSTSHYSTVYILQRYIKIVNQGKTICGYYSTNPHIDRKGQLRKYSRVLLTLSKYTYTQAMGYTKVRKIMNYLNNKKIILSYSHCTGHFQTFPELL